MIVVLCGYMGSGKTLIGKKLARRLEFVSLDLDDEIQNQEGESIPEIFKNGGEIRFRKLETEVLQSCLNRNKDTVLSLGGGTPCYGTNMKLLKNHKDTFLIYLKVNIQTLTARLFREKDSRPLIREIESKEKLNDFIRKHLFERQFFYYQCDITIDVSDLPGDEIVEELYDLTLDRRALFKK